MIYRYVCESCGSVLDRDFPFGKAAKFVTCKCKAKANRSFENAGVQLKGNWWPSKTNDFGEKQKKKNEKAGKNMRKTWGEQPKLVNQE
jgi:predicted nucleic acid-binding Zn ribbon protein